MFDKCIEEPKINAVNNNMGFIGWQEEEEPDAISLAAHS